MIYELVTPRGDIQQFYTIESMEQYAAERGIEIDRQ